MDIKPKAQKGSRPGKLQAVFNQDKAGYFNNILALAASLCASSFAAILTFADNLFIFERGHGFDDNTSPFDTSKILADSSGNLYADGFELNGQPIGFFAGVQVPVDLPEAPLWLCTMDYPPSTITQLQLTQLTMLAKQAAAVFQLMAKDLSTGNKTQVDRQLREQKAFYEKILNNIPTDIAVFDANHRYLFVNPGAISVKEYRDFIIGKDDYEYAAFRNRDVAIADERRAQFLQVKKNRQRNPLGRGLETARWHNSHRTALYVPGGRR
ncbi:hypothetical protein [Mucilaginibacter ginsenosidivorax]|uniref:PAS domain-containing protein n=1 Tax=Mucilaginibacter ginsenosidivorax TaxID=862126 RepID=A0A5B8VZV9_9SPHI|nr:hypothetical protein [Mucilaginibacter ginsenosidivorax]QEC76953.1 hypothetical protein FSB76_13735 [Mucilaginibacter ginsenosidivorax]